MIHELPKLAYSFDALEPYIDARTMEVHHDKHHQAYVNKLNDALKNYPDLQLKTLDELIMDLDSIPAKIRKSVKNNGGGHWNHSFFWRVMKPKGGVEPATAIAGIIKNKFKSFDKFKEKFTNEAANFFGSGWVWLVIDKKGNLKIISTQGHDTPISKGLKPLLVIDVWEHAYYLKYQNKKSDYINTWWNVVNWNEVESNYQKSVSA